MSNMYEQLNSIFQIVMLTTAIALVAAFVKELGVGIVGSGSKTVRPRTAREAMDEISKYDGWVLVTIDEDKCGYCGAAKIMLDVKGVPYKEVNITDMTEEELRELVKTLGIEHVPVLLYVEYGRIVLVKHFEGRRDKDIQWVRQIAA